MIPNIENLDVYRYAHDLTIKIYNITQTFPREEIYGLVSQMRRAAVSICSNLSEGGSRISHAEMKNFIGIARGSVAELRFQVTLSCDIGFIPEQTKISLLSDINKIHKMLTGLIAKV